LLSQHSDPDRLARAIVGSHLAREHPERLIGAEDQLKRVDILAPQDGVVNQLAVHTVGGVIANARC
jgi:hypothetical protein